MSKIPHSAYRAGVIEFGATGDRTELYLHQNANTGDWCLIQRCNGRVTRCSGRNLRLALAELQEVLNEGTARWVEDNEHTVQMLDRIEDIANERVVA